MATHDNQKHAEKILDKRCTNCGGRLKQFPIREDGDLIGHAIGCPNSYRDKQSPEVIREVLE